MRNVVKEIMHDCASKNIQANEAFVQYYCELLLLDPDVDLEDRTHIQSFIESVVIKLQNRPLDIIILQMQWFFTTNFDNKHRAVRKNRKDLEEKLKSLRDNIVETTTFPHQSTNIELVYRKIVYYIALMSGLGNPAVNEVFKETLLALKSILNESELKEFVESENQQSKSEQLRQMIKLVCGIRLFNRDCQKGGEGIQDLPQLLQKATVTCINDTQDLLCEVMNYVNLLTTALDMVYVTKQNQQNHSYIELELIENITVDDVENMKNHLVAYRQYEIYLRKMIDAKKETGQRVELFNGEFQKNLLEIHKVVRNRITIPVVQVFPKFTKLSEIWNALQDEAVLLNKLYKMANGLNDYIKALEFNPKLPEKVLKGNPVKTDAERLSNTFGKELIKTNEKIELIKSEDIQNIDKIQIQYLGFCAWKLVETQGALITGNPNLGIIKAMNMNFVFSSVEAGIEFGRCPEKYILDATNLVYKKPELINFLQLRNQLDVIKQITPSVTEESPEKTLQDFGIQTVTHPIPENIDKTYKWNIWEFRRDAIRTANFMKCKTLSVQTSKTYSRFSTSAQTYALKDQICQTKKDNYTNVPKRQNFIFGLRGRTDDKQFIVDLTRPVTE